jgi:hypothetical protein
VLGVVALATGVVELSRSDRSTVEALVTLFPGGMRGAVAVAGFLGGTGLVILVCRAWAALVVTTALAVVVWMAIGQPALERAVSRRDSLRPFAETVGRRYPPPASLVFFPDTIRSIVVYAGRRVPTVGRRRDLPPDTAVITTAAPHERLATAGVLGQPLLEATGRTGNVERATVVLAETTPTPPAPTR